MKKIHTHYDNLKVTRNAPIEVIRASYRTLSQKYHPDKNPGNSEATRIMSIINHSYEILCDPGKRQKHDQWIVEQEQENINYNDISVQKKSINKITSSKLSLIKIYFLKIVVHFLRYGLLYFIGIVLIWAFGTEEPSKPPKGPKPYQKTPPTETPKVVIPKYIKSPTAPNGEFWPSVAGYIKGYPRLKTSGYSVVTVDNSGNDSDVFVKLISLDGINAFPVRQFYIPAYGKFSLNKVTPGKYDIRYRDLETGHLSRSEAFQINETKNEYGVRYSNFRLTLYKVQNGNMETYNLSEEEF